MDRRCKKVSGVFAAHVKNLMFSLPEGKHAVNSKRTRLYQTYGLKDFKEFKKDP